jgi:hypothetical protein
MFDVGDDQKEKVEPVGAASETVQLRLVEGAAVVVVAAAAVYAIAAQVLDLREVQARRVAVEGVVLAGEENSVVGYHEVEEAPGVEAVQELGVVVVAMVCPLVVAERVAMDVRNLRTPGVVNAGAQASPDAELSGWGQHHLHEQLHPILSMVHLEIHFSKD